MNKTHCPRPDKKLFEHTVLPTLYILVFAVGLVLNVWGMKSLLHNWKKLRRINILVLNLGLADILYLLTLPFLVVYYLEGSKWIFGEGFCKATRFSFNLNLYGSIGFLTCISVYRYLAIVHPMRMMGRLTTTHSVVISAVVWILVSVQSLPDMFYQKTYPNISKCFDTTSNEHIESYLDYSLTWTFFGFCIPFVTIVGCYGHVTVVICRSNMMRKDQKRQILKLMALLILLFSLCYAPYHIFKNLSLYSRTLSNENQCPKWDSGVFIARQTSRGLVCLNSALNPLVYLQVNEDMGVQFTQLLQRCSQSFSCLLESKSRSVPVPQTEQEADSPL
ncbi:P2Y purinoceptor 1-like [Xiphophorus couchianus]|uniref:P2Y purinoceptor 1-like n=1 Tax=Xiphophorus couchianus TaxID=32473 RepID=UPI00101688BE|nr:P2Y purinoceptor 1-like [Xiphophorus couchianus]XP_027865995.1 P2Y purinoceptor 1-like [Xiphophorus couchianus]